MNDITTISGALITAVVALAGCVAHLYHRVIKLMQLEATCRQTLGEIKAELRTLKSRLHS